MDLRPPDGQILAVEAVELVNGDTANHPGSMRSR